MVDTDKNIVTIFLISSTVIDFLFHFIYLSQYFEIWKNKYTSSSNLNLIIKNTIPFEEMHFSYVLLDDHEYYSKEKMFYF